MTEGRGPVEHGSVAGDPRPMSSLGSHLLRGLLGFGGLIASVALLPVAGVAALGLLPLGLLALRGCPMCWLVSLRATLSAGRLERQCVDGRCELRPRSAN